MRTKLSLLLLLLLIPVLAYGWGIAIIGGDAEEGCDSCAGGLLFAWHAEDVDVTADSPCGCSAGDTTATLNGTAAISGTQYTDGDESLKCVDGTDYASFTITGYDIASDAAGTIVFDVYLVALDTYQVVFQAYGDANNRILVRVDDTNSDELEAKFWGGGTEIGVGTTVANIQVDTWYTITFKWRQGETDPSISLDANGDTVTKNDNLTDPTTEWSVLHVGTYEDGVETIYIDNVKVYDSWQ